MIIDATTFVPLLAACAHLFIFSYVFGQRQRSPVNYAFLVFSGGFFAICLMEFIIYLPVATALAATLARVAMFLMLLETIAVLYFVHAIVWGGRIDIPFKLISGAILLSALISIFIDHFNIVKPIGSPAGKLSPTMLHIPFVLIIAVSHFRASQILFDGWKNGTSFAIRRQCRLLLLGVLTAIGLSFFVLVILPLFLKNMALFRYSSVSTLIIMAFIYRAMQRYGLMTVDIETIRIVSDMLFRYVSYGIIVTDRHGLVIQSNSHVREILDLPEACTSFDSIRKALPGTDFSSPMPGNVVECATASGPKAIEISHTDFGGSHPQLGGITFFRDVTEQRRLEEAFAQKLRLESLGRLAGGIAHDFNNQLTGILGCADILHTELARHPEALKLTDIIIGAAERSAKLTRQMLAFSRRGKFQSIDVDMCSVVSEVITMLEHSIDKRIRISKFFRAEACAVMGDPAQLHHTILNIALNARDAMPEGGTLDFSLSNETAEGPENAHRVIKIVVSDTGFGIPLHLHSRIFEPFFTTKEKGKGTGMGLAAAYGTITAHHGTIKLESEVGKGTSVIIALPVMDTPPEERIAPSPAADASGPASLRILIVEDEATVAVTVQETLQRAGHNSCVAEDGTSAIARFEMTWRETDLVLLDLILPDITGHQIFTALRAINPAVNVLLTSGFTIDGGVQQILNEGARGFIQKPYQSSELIEKVHIACSIRS